MSDNETVEVDRFKFEREGLDFPFYNDNPHLSLVRWGLLLLGIIINFVLIMGSWEFSIFGGVSLKSFAYFLVPFLAFGLVANWKFDLICKKFKRGDLRLIVMIIILSFFYSIVMSVLLESFGVVAVSNPVRLQLGNLGFWAVFPFQIFGEELTKLILLILILFVSYKLTGRRRLSVVVATLGCAVIFGLLHMPAYGNFLVSILGVGFGDIIMIYGYLKTKNVLVPFFAHMFYNVIPWIFMFLMSFNHLIF